MSYNISVYLSQVEDVRYSYWSLDLSFSMLAIDEKGGILPNCVPMVAEVSVYAEGHVYHTVEMTDDYHQLFTFDTE